MANILLLSSQSSCLSNNRYLDSIFSQVDISTGILFGNADPFNPFSSNQDLYLDLYEPQGDTANARPLIIHAFGGGFLGGNRTGDDIPYWADQYVKKGYVFASIDYRLGFNPLDGGSVERAAYRCAQDYNAALRFLADNASTYRIDLNNVIVTGNSAGSIGALIVAFMDENDRPSSTFGTTLEGIDLGCFNCSGNTNFNNQQVPIKACINLWGAMLDTSFIDLSNHNDFKPTISFHGDNDGSVPYNVGHPYSLPNFPTVYGSNPIHTRMNNQNLPNQLVTFPGFPHEPEQTYPWVSDTIVSKVSKFVYPFIYGDSAKILGDNSFCVDSAVTVIAENHSNSSYCWDAPNATILSNSANTLTLSFNNTGSFKVYLTETDYKGLTKFDSIEIHVQNPPQSALAISGNDGLLNLQLLNTNIQNAHWNFGDGISSTTLNPVHQFTDTGYFTVQVQIHDAYCMADTQYIVLSNKCPEAQYSYELIDSTLYLYNESEMENYHYWIDYLGNVFTQDTLIYPLENEDDFPFILYTNNSFCSDSLQDVIPIFFCTNAAFSYQNNGLEVQFTDESYNAYFYNWDFGDATFSGVPNPFHSYADTGTYLVKLILTNIESCSDTLVKNISITNVNTSVRSLTKSINFYPNPTNGAIYINGLNNLEETKIEVFNYLGQLIFEGKANSTLNTLTNKESGIYFISLSNSKQKYSFKVFKQ